MNIIRIPEQTSKLNKKNHKVVINKRCRQKIGFLSLLKNNVHGIYGVSEISDSFVD